MSEVGNIDVQSYREQTVNLVAGRVNEIYFIDTKPNFIYITNLGTNDILVDDQPNVTANSYEVLAGAMMKRSLVKPLGISKLYIYSDIAEKVKVESGTAKLSLADIPMTQIVATLSNTLSISQVDVKKVIDPLPAGTNNIGDVGVVSMPDVNVVGLSTMITLLTDIKTELIAQTVLLNDIKTNTTPTP